MAIECETDIERDSQKSKIGKQTYAISLRQNHGVPPIQTQVNFFALAKTAL